MAPSVPSNSEECGLIIIRAFQENAELCQSFGDAISRLKTAFPTRLNQNKFMLGMAVEYVFVEMFNRSIGEAVGALCARNQTRTDVVFYNTFPLSLKYSTPSKTGKISNVRLINKHTSKEKKYEIDEDTIVIIPSTSYDSTKTFLNPEKGNLMKRTTRAAKKIIEKFSSKEIERKTAYHFAGKLVYIPKSKVTANDIKSTTDGIELKSSFINEYVKNESNKKYIAQVDIKQRTDVQEIDIIKLGIETCLDMKLKFC
jgi:hypothetical protein